jgi:hypothetical protein
MLMHVHTEERHSVQPNASSVAAASCEPCIHMLPIPDPAFEAGSSGSEVRWAGYGPPRACAGAWQDDDGGSWFSIVGVAGP